jgi:uncharacterized protein YunC (DUF1805 family)
MTGALTASVDAKMGAMMTRSWIRPAVLCVFVLGIAGMIIGSIADNNNGVVVTSGLVTATAALVLLAVNAVTITAPAASGTRTVDEVLAARVERRVDALVAKGADEDAVRDLVRDAIRFGRSST